MLSTKRPPTNYLIDDYPLIVLPLLAVAIGLPEAIALQQVHFLLGRLEGKVIDGKRWIHMTDKEWQAQFPFWSRNTIRRVLTKLAKDGYIHTGDYNDDPLDHTTWYTVDYDKVSQLPEKKVRKKRDDYPNFGQAMKAVKKGRNEPKIGGSSRPSNFRTVESPKLGQDSETSSSEISSESETPFSANLSIESSQAGDPLAHELDDGFKASKQLLAFQEKEATARLGATLKDMMNQPVDPTRAAGPAVEDARASVSIRLGPGRSQGLVVPTGPESFTVLPAPEPSAHGRNAEKEPTISPPGFKFMTGSDSTEKIHLRGDGKSLLSKPLCKASISHRYNPSQEDLKHKPRCEICWRIAAAPKPPKPPPKPRQPRPWDALANEIGRVFFEAKDQAGINAVMGRIAPILHGDKQHGRCDGILAYECERQGLTRDELDFEELATFAAKVWTYWQSKNPGKELKDCAKVLDNWQACRGLQVPAPPPKPQPVAHIRYTKDPVTGRDVGNYCDCELGVNHDA